MSNRLLLFLFLCFVAACTSNSAPSNTATALRFFDIKGFFEQEIAYLDAQSIKVQKTIQQNGEEERQEVSIGDWRQELSFFIESDLNKPSWRDQYSIDSSYTEDNKKLLLHYESQDKKLTIKALDVEIVSDTVQSIMIIKNINNQVYTSQQYLNYFPKKYYTINQTQNIVLLSKDDYNIEARYLYE
ncbi:MAG: hypothetical protein AB8E82_10570 [Aureispira sp.]